MFDLPKRETSLQSSKMDQSRNGSAPWLQGSMAQNSYGRLGGRLVTPGSAWPLPKPIIPPLPRPWHVSQTGFDHQNGQGFLATCENFRYLQPKRRANATRATSKRCGNRATAPSDSGATKMTLPPARKPNLRPDLMERITHLSCLPLTNHRNCPASRFEGTIPESVANPKVPKSWPVLSSPC